MRTILLFLMALAISVNAQLTSNQKIGAYAPGAIDPRTGMPLKSRHVPEWRKVGTNIMDASNFDGINGRITGKNKTVTFVHKPQDRHYIVLAVKNLTGDITQGRDVYFKATRDGVYNDDGTPLEQWDCGTIPTKTELQAKAEQDYREAKLAEAARSKIMELARAKANEKKKAADAVALKSNQQAAEKGDAYGLLRMGERYRDGDGVGKDAIKARDYFQKAADAGSSTAKESLEKLSAP